ncbi:MAG: glycosyltransferase family 61 protein [Bacteroidia bacterium]|nr:glycosyltransferase family 61 protein [Bacteroidia bacterium]
MSSHITQKFVNHSLGRTVYKSRYKPASVFDRLSDYLDSEKVGNDEGILLRESYRASTRYKQVFGKDLSPYLEDDMKSDGHETWIVSLENGRIDTDKGSSIAVFNRHGDILGDVSFSFVKRPEGGYDHGEVRQNNIFTRPFLTKPKKVQGTVFSLLTGGGGNANFYHWFVDVLSRLALLRESRWQHHVDYFLVPNFALSFQKESFELLGIPPEKVINGMEFPHIQADRLIVASHPRTTTYFVPQYITEFLHEAFTGFNDDIEDDTIGDHPYLYISRGDAPKRKVVNEAEIISRLEKMGFTSFALSNYSLRQAIQLFRKAEIIVAPHGAGLTNLLFCTPGARVLELFSDKFVNHYFYEFANHLNLLYDYQVGIPLHQKVVKSRYEGIEEDMKIDVEALVAKISAAMSISS